MITDCNYIVRIPHWLIHLKDMWKTGWTRPLNGNDKINNKLKNLFDSKQVLQRANVGIFLISTGLKIMRVHKKVLQLLGTPSLYPYRPASLLNPSYWVRVTNVPRSSHKYWHAPFHLRSYGFAHVKQVKRPMSFFYKKLHYKTTVSRSCSCAESSLF